MPPLEDDDVLSSDAEGHEGEISDDSQDLLAAADSYDSDLSVSSLEANSDADIEEVDDQPEEDLGNTREQRTEDPSDVKPHQASTHAADEQADMFLMAQATSDSMVMQLQVAELLNEVKVSLSGRLSQQVAGDISRLQKVLKAISPHKVDTSCCEGFIKELGLSIEAVSLTFEPPAVVAAVGSLPLNGAVLQTGPAGKALPVTLDVAVVMPDSCFFRKAHLNYRYHAMRALYLHTIARHLAACPAFASRSTHLEALQDDPTRPVLVVSGPGDNSSSGPSYQLRVLPCCSPSTFPLQRLLPDRNGVRWVTKKASSTTGKSGVQNNTYSAADASATTAAQQGTSNKQQTLQPITTAADANTASLVATPTYNMGIMSDMMMLSHASILHKAAHRLPAFADGLVLLKVWAQEHGLGGKAAPDGLNGHCLALLLAHLVEQNKLAPSMSPLQVFRVTLQSLSGGDATSNLSKSVTMTTLDHGTCKQMVQSAVHHMLVPTDDVDHHSSKPSRPASQGHLAAEQAAMVVCTAMGEINNNTSTGGGNAKRVTGNKAQPLVSFNSAPATHSAAFKKAHTAVLLDPFKTCNVAYTISKPALSATTAAAKASLALLNKPSDAEAALASVLLSPTRPAATFDYMWAVDFPAAMTYPHLTGQAAAAQSKATAQESEDAGVPARDTCMVGDVCVWRDQEAQVESLTKSALTDRSTLVRSVRRSIRPSPVSQLSTGILRVERSHEVLVGARIDPTKALRLVDIGPAADDVKAAAKFRAFWGPASELRRFQDGKISEAVVWSGPAAGPGSRHNIPDKIVDYALRRHKPAGALGTMRSSGGALDAALVGQDPDTQNLDAAALSERSLDAAIDKLGKQLRALEGLALKIVAVLPLGAAARHTEVFPPSPHPLAGGVPAQDLGKVLGPGTRLARCLQPVDLLVQLEGTGRWPSNAVALKKMKAALGVQLAQTLESSLNLHVQASEECVDVLYEGFAMRLTLFSGRDEDLQLTSADLQGPETPALPGLVNAASVSVEAPVLARSWHHGLVSRVGGANPSFAPACRLAKRWVSSHCLSNHIRDEAVEVLMMSVYAHPGPRGQPGSRTAGFLRFLQLLAQHPWAARPLCIDPDAVLKPGDHSTIQHKFSERRGTAGGNMPALYLVTPRDHTSSHWTQEKPSPSALAHMVALARNCLAAAGQLLEAFQHPGHPITHAYALSSDEQSFSRQEAFEAALQSSLYNPELEQYDVILELRGEGMPRASQGLPEHLAGQAKRRRQPDVLSEVLEEDDGSVFGPPSKRSRAFLDAFPEKAVATRGPAALREELLIGFDPLSDFVKAVQSSVLGGAMQHGNAAATTQATGGVAGTAPLALPLLGSVYLDECGGQHVGLKWSPAAFLPSAAQATCAHTRLPCLLTGLAAQGDNGKVVDGCVPHVSRVLAEMMEIGEGLADSVTCTKGCYRLPAAV